MGFVHARTPPADGDGRRSWSQCARNGGGCTARVGELDLQLSCHLDRWGPAFGHRLGDVPRADAAAPAGGVRRIAPPASRRSPLSVRTVPFRRITVRRVIQFTVDLTRNSAGSSRWHRMRLATALALPDTPVPLGPPRYTTVPPREGPRSHPAAGESAPIR